MKLIYHLRLLSFACIGLLLGSFPALAQRTATGEPVVYFGFVVTITVIDPGAGYVNPPTVSITGGGGTGALAEATITNGAVSHVTMLDAGSGYTNQPTVEFSPPPRSTTIGLRMVPPVAEMVDDLRNEEMITVAAGDNVVRLLPPLIIGDAEISEAIARIDRACVRLEQAHPRQGAA